MRKWILIKLSFAVGAGAQYDGFAYGAKYSSTGRGVDAKEIASTLVQTSCSGIYDTK